MNMPAANVPFPRYRWTARLGWRMTRWILCVLVLSSLLAPMAKAQAPVEKVEPTPMTLPGVQVAQAITEITGVAVSPLAGLSAVGAWRYFRAPENGRAALPWFCRPWFWGTGLAIFLLGSFKTTVASVLPPFALKPLDYVGVIGNMAGAALAVPGFVPLVIAEFEGSATALAAAFAGGPLPVAMLPLAAGPLAWWMWIAVPVAVGAFLIVWLGGHAITVLSALSPVGFLTALLKLFKAVLVGLIALSAVVSPWLGAAFCLLIFAVAALVAPWAFRLTVFGTAFVYDVLLPGRAKRHVRVQTPHAFLACRLGRVRVRTYGRLALTAEGLLVFQYRPWMILPWRNVVLPSDELAIEKGFFHPSLSHRSSPHLPLDALVHFLPRYRKHEEEISRHLGIPAVVDPPIVRGFRALCSWLSENLLTRQAAHAHPSLPSVEPSRDAD